MNEQTELRDWLIALRTPGLGPVGLRDRLEAAGGCIGAVLAQLRRQASQLGAPAQAWLERPDEPRLAADLAWLGEPQHRLLRCTEADFPPQLETIPQPPVALFVAGDAGLLLRPQVAIVGARSASMAGKGNAHAFSRHLALAGFVITSGLADGIDGAAHEAALEAGQPTIAVIGTGPDLVYPRKHRELAHRIAAQGALVSEFLPGTAARPDHFPRRNRLIAGLALGIVVIEAGMQSGSLITARLAVDDYNREVFAIPGRVDSPVSVGTNNLIKTGRAKLVENVQDILDSLGEVGEELSKSLPAAPGRDAPNNRPDAPTAAQPAAARAAVAADPDEDEAPLFAEPAPEPAPAAKPVAAAPAKPGFTQAQQRILTALADGDALHVDLICDRAGLAAAVVMAELTMLQIRGAIKRLPGNKFARR
jgi:DNA processing protein